MHHYFMKIVKLKRLGEVKAQTINPIWELDSLLAHLCVKLVC